MAEGNSGFQNVRAVNENKDRSYPLKYCLHAFIKEKAVDQVIQYLGIVCCILAVLIAVIT